MNICKNCKHCKHPFGSEFMSDYRCLKAKETTNPVTGYASYLRCDEINYQGKCEVYEPSILAQIKSFFGYESDM